MSISVNYYVCNKHREAPAYYGRHRTAALKRACEPESRNLLPLTRPLIHPSFKPQLICPPFKPGKSGRAHLCGCRHEQECMTVELRVKET